MHVLHRPTNNHTPTVNFEKEQKTMINSCSRTLSIISYKHQKSSLIVVLARRRASCLVSGNKNNLFRITSVCGWSNNTRSSSRTVHDFCKTNMALKQQQMEEGSTSSIDVEFVWNPKGMLEELTAAAPMVGRDQWKPERCLAAFENYHNHLKYSSQHGGRRTTSHDGDDGYGSSIVYSSATAVLAIRCLVKSKLPTHSLRHRIRDVERTMGLLADPIPMTEALSFVLLEAHGKAGNVGRAMSLLEYRRLQNCRPYSQRPKEFFHAVLSIESAGVEYRTARNPKIPEGATKCKLDDPTRWLDCILLNMHRRGIQLDIHLANAMLSTFSSTGRTGRALHWFYKLKPIPTHTSSSTEIGSNNQKRLHMIRRGPPPSYQLPSQSMKFTALKNTSTTTPTAIASASSTHTTNDEIVTNSSNNKRTTNIFSSLKLSKEMNPKWSLPLTAAFAFAKSLSQGACGHEPINLDIVSYNKLLKACCYRGALCRAIYLVREEIPNMGLEPNTTTYNTLLHGLARVADMASIRELLIEMTNKNINLSDFTVQAIVLGYLNGGDVGGAITLVQDIFNQHGVLPPYTSHLDILEHCLVNDLLFEAKRHVYFIQQVWKFDPPHDLHMDKVTKIKFVQQSPKLGKEALKKLFEYHGETLTDADFF